jgi:tRNA(His) guanylyltransferase
MKTDDLEASMRELEWFHGLRALPGAWIVLRVDGRSFTNGFFAYTESDEASVLLRPDTELFKSRSGEARLDFSRHRERGVLAQAGHRSAFRQPSLAVRHGKAGDRLLSLAPGRCHAVLLERLVLLDDAQVRQDRETGDVRVGRVGFLREERALVQPRSRLSQAPGLAEIGHRTLLDAVEKRGTNPKTGETTRALRRSVAVDEELPRGEDYSAFLQDVLSKAGESAV